ncbi:MAG: STAS domain-containing protein [Janthinobacterium lividum]
MTSPDFRVRRRQVGPVSVLSPIGELNVETTATLSTATTTTLRRARAIVVDLSGLSFLDCHAVGALLTLARQAEEGGARLQVAALPDHVHQLFSIFDLYGVLGGRRDVAAECRVAISHLAASRRVQVPA